MAYFHQVDDFLAVVDDSGQLSRGAEIIGDSEITKIFRSELFFPIIGSVAGPHFKVHGRQCLLPENGFISSLEKKIVEKPERILTTYSHVPAATETDKTIFYPYKFTLKQQFQATHEGFLIKCLVTKTGGVQSFMPYGLCMRFWFSAGDRMFKIGLEKIFEHDLTDVVNEWEGSRLIAENDDERFEVNFQYVFPEIFAEPVHGRKKKIKKFIGLSRDEDYLFVDLMTMRKLKKYSQPIEWMPNKQSLRLTTDERPFSHKYEARISFL